MPLTNLNAEHFSPVEKDQINTHWAAIRQIIEVKNKNLSPEERQKYGSVSEQNKLVVMKVLEYHQNQPHLNCPELDYDEVKADWDDRSFLAGLITSMDEAMGICNNIRIMHDYDAFQAARIDYDYTKYRLATASGAGWETKYNDLLVFFKTNDGSSNTPTPPPAG